LSSQAKAIDTLQLDSLNVYYELEKHLSYHVDETNKETILTISKQDFKKQELESPYDLSKTYWASFYLANEQNVEYELGYNNPDSMIYYIPQKDSSYLKIVRGLFTKELGVSRMENYLSVSSDNIDFSRPVFIKLRSFSTWSKTSRLSNLLIYKYKGNDKPNRTENNFEEGLPFIIFIAIVFFLSCYFFIQYLINKRESFLLYSAYLCTLLIYFANRSTFFDSWFIASRHNYFFYLNENMQILSAVFYFAFMRKFLNTPIRYPKFDKVLWFSILTFLCFMIFYNLLFYFNRFNPLHLKMMDYFRIFNAVVSICFVIKVIRNKPKVIELIAVVSSVILMLGAVVPTLLGEMTYSLIFLVMEIFVLAIGLAYQVRQGDLERLKTKERLIEQLELNAIIQQEMQNKLETEVRIQTKKAIQKTQEAEEIKAEQIKEKFQIELEQIKMKALQAQMNPHFLFNCLNSIRLFYLKNETKKADVYITKFSRLLRLMLNNSRVNLISLSEELDALKLYIDFEQMRFKDKFEFELKVDNRINVMDFKIQPLTLQPFVENAIWHGLMQQNKKGKLIINIEKEENRIIINIEDNGIGRAKAKKLKEGQSQIYQSHGLQITKERMDLMKKSLNRTADFKIIDLKNEIGTAIGTIVEIVYS
jgi:sensor histidine kinase YesM